MAHMQTAPSNYLNCDTRSNLSILSLLSRESICPQIDARLEINSFPNQSMFGGARHAGVKHRSGLNLMHRLASLRPTAATRQDVLLDATVLGTLSCGLLNT
jgi:hypothetical protein